MTADGGRFRRRSNHSFRNWPAELANIAPSQFLDAFWPGIRGNIALASAPIGRRNDQVHRIPILRDPPGMSEYQYYEFQAIDRPLDRAAQEALRSISSRARITATSFTNHYEWGDLKGDPRKLMERWFDLHLYLGNWRTRRLMMRLPKRFLNLADIDP